VIALAAGIALVGVASLALSALFRPDGVAALALTAALVAFVEIVLVSHGLSLFDAYERGPLLAALAAVAALALAVVAIARPPVPPLPHARAVREVLADPVLGVLAVIVALELCYLVALATLTPPTENDALTYHLTRAILWIQQSSLAPIHDAGDWRINGHPRNAELLDGFTMLLSGSLRWVSLVQVAALGVTMVAIHGTAGRIGLDRRAAAFGALLYPTLPVVALQAPIAKNDLVVGALVAVTAFFLLGRSAVDIPLAVAAGALLMGTKVTALLAVPALLAVAALAPGRASRRTALAVGAVAAVAIGGAAYLAHLDREGHSPGGVVYGRGNRLLSPIARTTRYAVETFELPGAWGRNVFLYVVVAAALAALGLVRRKRAVVAAAALVALAPVVLPVESVLMRVYWHFWELFGYEPALHYGTTRDATIASAVQSWFGPVGLALVLAALVLVTRAARRGRLPWVGVALAAAPVLVLVMSATLIGYHPYSGRYVMGGVALSAATWGLVRGSRWVSWALVAVTATTLLLSLLDSREKPTGIGVLESSPRRSVWTLPREWSQNTKPELAPITRYVDDHAAPGSTIALTRSSLVYPAIYVGWPRIAHRLVYADTLTEAARRGGALALLPTTAPCAPGWKRVVDSPPWALWEPDADAVCDPG
jgi:hypothetical protein